MAQAPQQHNTALLRRWAAAIGALILAGLVGFLDARFGGTYPLWAIGVVPVLLGAWYANTYAAFIAAVTIAGSPWLIDIGTASPGPRAETPESAWSSAAAFLILSVVAVLGSLLRQSRSQAKQLARTDALTGLENRHAFFERATAEMNRSRRTGRPFTLAFIDCDRLKQVNDSRGHLAGDKLLCAVATTLRASTRNYDLVARLGGDEFLVLLPDTDAQAARVVVARMQSRLGDTMKQHAWPVTFSIGVATFLDIPESVDATIHSADELMYAVKSTSKDAAKFATFGGS